MNAPFNPNGRFTAAIYKGEVTGPGLYLDVGETVYHSDPCPEPSLSSHVAKIALAKSALHAREKHPRLRKPPQEILDLEEEEPAAPKENLLIGSAAHSFLTRAGAPVKEIVTKNFRSKGPQEERKAAIAEGFIPLRSSAYHTARRMAEIARPVWCELFGCIPIPEAMLAWQEGGLWRRGLIDGVSPNLRIAGDYKTSGVDCPPPRAAHLTNERKYPFQERFYARGFDALDPDGMGARKFYFMFQEVEWPHAISIIEVDEAGRSLADEQVSGACAIWDRAMRTGLWPGYPRQPYSSTPKPFALQEWEERAMSDETLNPMESEA